MLRRLHAWPGILLAAVPPQLQKNEGLLFERLRMRRRKNNDAGAMEIIAAMPQHTSHPENWWGELNILAAAAWSRMISPAPIKSSPSTS